MKRVLLSLALCTALFSCNETPTEPSEPTPEENPSTLNLTISATAANGREWASGEAISVATSTLKDNDNAQFTAQSQGATSSFSGKLSTWSGEQTIYSVSPYSQNGYFIDTDDNTVGISLSSTMEITTDMSDELPSVMVATSEASCPEEEGAELTTLNFKEVLSFFELALIDIPQDEVIVEMSLKTDEDSFITYTNIDFTTAQPVGKPTLTSKLTASVSDQSDQQATLLMPLLPVDMTGVEITLSVKTINGGGYTTYKKTIEQGLQFNRGEVTVVSDQPLTLQTDFTVPDAVYPQLALEDFKNMHLSAATTWIVTDSEAAYDDFVYLKEKLTEAHQSNRRITLQFPNLKEVPDSVFKNFNYGVTEAVFEVADSITSQLFYNCQIIEKVSAPLAIGVGELAFTQSTTIREVIAPEVRSVGKNAFYGASALESLQSDALSYISDYAFRECSSLVDIDLSNVSYVGASSFACCRLLPVVDLPLATSVGVNAFIGCRSVGSISIPELTTIGAGVFFSCDALKEVYAPKVKSLGDWAFRDCISLEEVALPEVSVIGSLSFRGCSNLRSVQMPELTIAANQSFQDCTMLSDVELPKLTSLGSDFFKNCTSLVSISLPAGYKLEYSVFEGCTELTSVSIADAFLIYKMCFIDCPKLSALTLSTNEGRELSRFDEEMFDIDGVDNAVNIDLTIGQSNAKYISGNRLEVGDYSYTFKSITIQ